MRYCVLKVYDYKYINLICQTTVTVTSKDYPPSLLIYEAVNLSCYILGAKAVNDAFFSKLKFKVSFLFRYLCAWEWFIS